MVLHYYFVFVFVFFNSLHLFTLNTHKFLAQPHQADQHDTSLHNYYRHT